jgi:hypothetical protein
MVKLDYAPHYLEAKRQLEETYQLILRNELSEAAGKIEFAIVELRMMKTAINSNIPDAE